MKLKPKVKATCELKRGKLQGQGLALVAVSVGEPALLGRTLNSLWPYAAKIILRAQKGWRIPPEIEENFNLSHVSICEEDALPEKDFGDSLFSRFPTPLPFSISLSSGQVLPVARSFPEWFRAWTESDSSGIYFPLLHLQQERYFRADEALKAGWQLRAVKPGAGPWFCNWPILDLRPKEEVPKHLLIEFETDMTTDMIIEKVTEFWTNRK